MKPDTTSRVFFEKMYAKKADPWGFATSAYERERYASILRVLGHRRYERAFEPGCSVGVLTEKLATLCETLEAMDIAPTAVQRANERCRHLPNVSIRCGALPADVPDGRFDLIVFSEIGYYFSEEALRQLGAVLVGRLLHGGVFVAGHWLGRSKDHVLSGDQVHAELHHLDGLNHEHEELHATPGQDSGYRLDRWVRA